MSAVALPSSQWRGAAPGLAAQAAPTEPCRPSGPRLANFPSLTAKLLMHGAVQEPSGPKVRGVCLNS